VACIKTLGCHARTVPAQTVCASKTNGAFVKRSSIIVAFLKGQGAAHVLRNRFLSFQYSKIIQFENHGKVGISGIERFFAARWWICFEVIFFLISALICYMFATNGDTINGITSALLFLVLSNMGLLIGEQFLRKYDPLVKRFQTVLMEGEIIIIVECPLEACHNYIDELQNFQLEFPTFFLFQAEEEKDPHRVKEMLPQTPVPLEELQQLGQNLASLDLKVDFQENKDDSFFLRVTKITEKYQSIYSKLSDFALFNENLQLSAEWLLQNSYIVKKNIEEVYKNLPKEFFKNLPYIDHPSYQGVPRVYLLACRLVAATDGRITKDSIVAFINGYQKVTPLTMGEFWAFPLILKIRLLECLIHITKVILNRVQQTQLADFWANRMLNALQTDPEKLYPILSSLTQDMPAPSSYFADQLLIQLGDTEQASQFIKGWLNRKVGEDLATIFKLEQSEQTFEQTSLGNLISSFSRLTQIDWREMFQEESVIEKILSEDALGAYSQMDFNTRDQYRHVVEKLARSRHIDEREVAKAAVKLTQEKTQSYEKHVGYYLIDEGYELLEKQVGYVPTLSQRVLRFFSRHREMAYFGVLTFVSLLFLTVYYFSINDSKGPSWFIIVMMALAVLPLIEIALQVINYAIARKLLPNILPKMNFDEGIPAERRTLVVMPTLLSKENIEKDLERLEIHYLANRDPHLLFALVTDFQDAAQENLVEDSALIKMVTEGITRLNEKYEEGKFYLFHRPRRWNEGEGCWMGWERKRGKLEELHNFLMGEENAIDDLLHVGDPTLLEGIRYILTVDSDTQLPKDSVRHLVETISHPLNAAQVDSKTRKVLRGYTIVQPRVSTSFISAYKSWFSRLFSDHSGVDPYSKSVSDIYQDIFQEGIYHGKAIYDHRAFHTVLKGRFVENQVLSHDLLEGCYVRTAFASDIELHDTFPSTYSAYCKRHHRWVRGDWQLLPWLKGYISNFDGIKEYNPLSAISRWKIIDNLKRSLIPLILMAILVLAWNSDEPLEGTVLVIITVAVPFLLQCCDLLWNHGPRRLSDGWSDFKKGSIRTLVQLSFLPHQAWVNLDAIVRALYRQCYSKKSLLEWQISTKLDHSDRNHYQNSVIVIAGCSLLISIYLLMFKSEDFFYALPLILLWAISPVLQKELERGYLEPPGVALGHSSKRYLHALARKTWRYFDDFVTEDVNWLPPDNYQAGVRFEIAYRTSPTNIGFYLTSLISAHAFGYINNDKFIQDLLKVVQTLKKMERVEGHFLNWYDIKTLDPLMPRYISTVDSGNLLASLWTVQQQCHALLEKPMVETEVFFSGLDDALRLLQESIQEEGHRHHVSPEFLHWRITPNNVAPLQYKRELQNIIGYILEQTKKLPRSNPSVSESSYWLEKLIAQATAEIKWLETAFGWIELLSSSEANTIMLMHSEGQKWSSLATEKFVSFQDVIKRNVPGLIPLIGWLQSLNSANLEDMHKEWIQHFLDSVTRLFSSAEEAINSLNNLISDLHAIDQSMNMAFLYNSERKLFTIGYNVTERHMDNSCYDLLASEARLSSFIAIARGEAPLEHWWALGRPIGNAFGKLALQSWGGTMFEYLMPLVWCRNFSDTLLDFACKVAVQCQIIYGNQRGIPWGISESAYSRLDIHKIYQYRAFGVPYLGLKQSLEKDLVVTPYSSSLALMVDPNSSVRNLLRLGLKEKMHGKYGHYEAIDFSRASEMRHGIIIHTYMAHHMGMSLGSYCNTLLNGVIQNLFHSHPSVRAMETILYERSIATDSRTTSRVIDQPFPKVIKTIAPVSSHFDTPLTPIPMTHLLSNGNYSVMITNTGGGYSKFKDIDITRWRDDPTCERGGTYFYIRDLEKHTVFNPCHQPLCHQPGLAYYANFTNHKAEIIKKEYGIESTMEVVVSPEDNVEIRSIKLSNRALRRRSLDITSYVEIALAPHKADRAHPAFSKMFVQTEAIEELKGLIAHRRPRSVDDPYHWCFHIAALAHDQGDPSWTFETDRNIFIGRNNTLNNPRIVGEELSNSQGCVLDPIFSIRRQLEIDEGKQIKISFITGYATSREECLKLMEKYRHLESSMRMIDMSWAHAELDLRRLHITQEDAKVFQRLGNSLIFPDMQFRASPERLRRNHLNQEQLWCYGISGDNPILLGVIGDVYDIEVIQSLLQSHAFWHLRGLKADLVILNEEEASYEKPLNESLVRLAQNFAQYTGFNISGGIFIVAEDQMSREQQDLLFTVANVVIQAARGSLSQHLTLPRTVLPSTSLLKADSSIPEEPSAPLPFLELLYFNGTGGFTTDGKEYAIYLDQNKSTPMPWCNVIANENFGSLATDSGLGASWTINSQSNRLTPWSNDPTSNQITDTCYIRDDHSGTYWTVTPSPIRENDPYRTRHGQGYTVYEHNSHAIEQEMTVFVPFDNSHSPVRIQILKLTNRSSHMRKLSIFSYTDLVLGTDREETERYVVTNWNPEIKAITAYNHYRINFSDHIAFLSSSEAPVSFTGSRKSFLGTGAHKAPEIMKNLYLPQLTGAGLDPCAALQVPLELYSGETTEIIFVFGESSHILKAKGLIEQYQSRENAHKALQETKDRWDKALNQIQVETPDKSLDLLFNRWLIYQTLSCRMWGRTAFYQSGGAYGYRDQLQDAAALVYTDPALTRRHILLCASRQFVEGDVQHWWHPENGAGVRTRISDDLLWLPYVTMHYIKVTGDRAIMDEMVSYLEAPLLAPEEHEIFGIPKISTQQGSLKEHCMKAIEKSFQVGAHKLPLIGGGDWNDGMNRVGIDGKGESVWLAWFLIDILNSFSDWLISVGGAEKAEEYKTKAKELLRAIEEFAWDGEWYIRAFFDDGSPIGSHTCEEDKIDSLSQTWGVLNNQFNARTAQAMDSVEKNLIDERDRLVLLYTPPFDKSAQNPGYLKGYPPGVRENGGQYTHAAVWVAMAFARQGQPEKAMHVIQMINPINRSNSAEEVSRYLIEPYVTAGDIYKLAGHEGRGGWSWYTGSSSVLYRALLEEIFGFRLEGAFLVIDPVIPADWGSFKLIYRYHESRYEIVVENPQHIKKGVVRIEVNGVEVVDKRIPLSTEKSEYQVRVLMGVH